MKKDDPVTLQELVVTNMLELDALVQLLVRKEIITEAGITERDSGDEVPDAFGGKAGERVNRSG